MPDLETIRLNLAKGPIHGSQGSMKGTESYELYDSPKTHELHN